MPTTRIPYGVLDGRYVNSEGDIIKPVVDSTTLFQVLNAAGSTAVLNVDTENERVGIGTDSPDSTLHIVADINGGYVEPVVENTATSGAAGFSFKTSSKEWKMGVNTYNEFRIRDDTLGKNVFVILGGAGTNSLVIDSGSKIGINTSYPRRRLDILDTSAAQIRLTHTDNSIYTDIKTDSNGDLTITPSGDEIILPAGKNLTFATATGTKIGTAANQLLSFYGAEAVDQPATVSDPTGGGTVDAEARTAIIAVIDRLQELGLIA